MEILQEDQPYLNMIESSETGVDFRVNEDDVGTVMPSFFQNTHHPLESEDVSWLYVSADWTRSTTITTNTFMAKWSLYGLDDHGIENLIAVKSTTICTSPTTGLETVLFDLKGSGGVCPVQKITGTTSPGKIKVNLPLPYENYYSITMTGNWTPVTPNTASDEDQTLYFTTPASNWAENTPVIFSIEEYNMDAYYTRPVKLSSKNVVDIKYDNIDKYWAMRLKYEAEHTDEFNVNISKITYKYEV